MVLDELHVLERSARAIGQRHSVAGLDAGVRREGKHAAAAAGAQDDRARRDRLHAPGHQLQRHHPLYTPIVDQQLRDEPLVVADDGRCT